MAKDTSKSAHRTNLGTGEPGTRSDLPDGGDQVIADGLEQESPKTHDTNTGRTDIWSYREAQGHSDRDLTGYKVEAVDGEIGSIDEASNELAGSYIVVDTGPWILGKKVLLPAGVIQAVNVEDERVIVNRTKDQIENAPEFDEDRYRDEMYRSDVGTYYDEGGRGYRDW